MSRFSLALIAVAASAAFALIEPGAVAVYAIDRSGLRAKCAAEDGEHPQYPPLGIIQQVYHAGRADDRMPLHSFATVIVIPGS